MTCFQFSITERHVTSISRKMTFKTSFTNKNIYGTAGENGCAKINAKQYVIHMFAQSLTADKTTTADVFCYFKQDVFIIL